MWAVVKVGTTQYKVREGDVIRVQRLNKASGSKVTLDEVMLCSKNEALDIGKPYIKGAKVEAEVLSEAKDKKVIVFKFKRRKNYQRKRGHRQILTSLKILKIKKK